MNYEKLEKICKLLYQTPTTRIIINSETNEVYKNQLTNNLICGLEKINKVGKYNVYVRKYQDITNIRTIILDFDNNNAYDDVYNASALLEKHKIMNLVVNSTNKGYHLYILLPKPLNFCLTGNKNMNNKIFTDFIINLIGDSESLDKANYGLYSNIRMIGSTHPKTRKVLLCTYAYAPFVYEDTLKVKPEYYMNKNHYFYDSFVKSLSYLNNVERINNTIKTRSRKVRYTNNAIDLRELFDGKSFDNGKSLWTKCPWHNDTHPSLHVYEKVLFCSVCGQIPFKKIKEHFNL